MKLSYNLLKEFVKINLSPEKLGQILTEHAFEVEEVKELKPEFSGIVTARVLEVKKHPNADRLRVAKVDVGNRVVEPVVCGAFNFEAGDMVALALPGAKIARNIHSEAHEPFVLDKAKIRGIESQGMICAAFELGLSDEIGEGILVLDKSVKPGLDLAELFSGSDALIEVSLPANRPDLHSHMGIAREAAAVLGLKYKEPEFKSRAEIPSAKDWRVEVKDKVLCPKYYGLRLSKVKVGPSPKFIQDVLKTVGQRPVNNVVDITNFVMLELGQPLHAFDAKKVSGNIIVRRAKPDEKFTAINHKNYVLDKDTLVIADEQKALALAGIMGGAESEVSEQTTDLVLEAANFNQFNIRRTARKLGLRSDSSALFEKGLHPNLVNLGLSRATELLMRYAGAEIEALATFETKAPKPPTIKFNAEEINKLLGTTFNKSQIKKYLSRYGIAVKDKGLKIKDMPATPPWWRTDLQAMPDLAEEVLKLYGYNKVKPQALIIAPQKAGAENGGKAVKTDFIYAAKEFWVRLGYVEVQNYNFVSEKDILNFGGDPKDYLEIQNPLSADQRYLKRHLLIPMLKNVALNQRNFDDFRIFEVGKQYLSFENEPILLSTILFSKIDATEKLVAEAKAAVLEYLKSVGLRKIEFTETGKPWLAIKHQDQVIGLIGAFEAGKLENFDIEGSAAFVKLELGKLANLREDIVFKPYSRFPGIVRDISLVVKKDTKWQQIESIVSAVTKAGEQIVVDVSLLEAPYLATDKTAKKFHEDLGKKGQKNLVVRLTFSGLNKTLKESEISGIFDQIVLKLQRELKAEIR